MSNRFDFIGGITRDGELIILFPSVSEARHKYFLLNVHLRERCKVVITTRGAYERGPAVPMANK